ncbi:MAG: DUF5711 family protein [Clostridia bacterium]|nr:DUF5711 family protein [Clostridia bacterium]MDY5554980.1 DUF5711 family protein [Blautia sp.]
MANTIKKMIRKHKKKKLMAQKARLARQQGKIETEKEKDDYQTRLSKHKRKVAKKTLITVTAVIVIVAAFIIYMEKRSYHNYKILQTSEQEDIVSTNYVEMEGNILRYSPDGVSLVSNKMETLWSETYSMQNPVADVQGSRAVIADKDGNSIFMFDKNGKTGNVTTSYSIVKAKVSENGLVAAILDGGDDTWINFYSFDGSLIAENQTRIDDPGYPLDVAISDNGVIMMVTYQFVDGNDTTSYVAFYNFGDVGQNEDDRIVSGYKYKGVVVPQIEYLDQNRSIAIRDDGFTLYRGGQIPKEVKTIKEDKEIVSTFFDDDLVGLVFKNDSKDKLYTMNVYKLDGTLKFKKDFNIPYTTIKMSDGNILMYNSSQICIMNSKGVQKYMGAVDGTVKNFFKIGWNRYILVSDGGVNLIKLS